MREGSEEADQQNDAAQLGHLQGCGSTDVLFAPDCNPLGRTAIVLEKDHGAPNMLAATPGIARTAGKGWLIRHAIG